MKVVPKMLNRMAIGIVDDAETALNLCQRLLAAGSAARQIFLLDMSSLKDVEQAETKLALKRLPSVAGSSLWTPDRQRDDYSNGAKESDNAVAPQNSLRDYFENCPENQRQVFQTRMSMGQLIVVMLLNSPWEEVVYGRIILGHASDCFQTVALG